MTIFQLLMKTNKLIIAGTIFATSSLHAGVLFEVETKYPGGSDARVEVSQVLVDGKNLKMDVASGGRGESGSMLYRGARGEMVVIDDSRRSYMVFDEAQMEQTVNQLSDAMKQMESILQNMPPERRDMVEQMMRKQMPAQAAAAPKIDIDIKKVGDQETIEGYPCVKYDVLRDGKRVRELWITDWSNVEGGEEAADAFIGLADYTQKMVGAFSQGMGAKIGNSMESAYTYLKEINGFPVLTRELNSDGSVESESTLKSAKKQSVAPSEFQVPEGYRQQQMPGM